MYHVDVNVDPQKIGHGELALVVRKALDEHFGTTDWANGKEASFQTSVTYTNPFKKERGTLMNSEDPLAVPRGIRNAAILAILFFWLPLTVLIIVAATR